MMNFIYDPILGLRYCFTEVLVVDLLELGEVEYSFEALMDLWRRTGVKLVNTTDNKPSFEPALQIHTNI